MVGDSDVPISGLRNCREVRIIGRESGRSMDVIPVIEMNLEKNKGRPVFIADKELSEGDREKIRAVASEVTDFTGALSNTTGFLPVSTLLSLSSGPVTLVVDGKEREYKSGAAALESLKDRYSVKSIKGAKIELEAANDWTAGFAADYKAVTGEDVSFI